MTINQCWSRTTRSLPYTSIRIRHFFSLRDLSRELTLFQSLNISSICHRIRITVKASSAVNRLDGTLVTRIVQSAMAKRRFDGWRPFFLASARIFRRLALAISSATRCARNRAGSFLLLPSRTGESVTSRWGVASHLPRLITFPS